jgi:hypothetical protein
MTDLSFATREMATQRIAERIESAESAERSRLVGRRSSHGRHQLARGLHRIADRIDN